jgi:maleate cis-trans isomerase
VAGLEAECGKPVVASDGALYWAMLRELDLGDPVAGRGALLESL